jgi:hypothetical protein
MEPFGGNGYLAQEFMTDEGKAMLPSDQLELLENTLAWATAAFVITFWAGVLGCIGLLVRKKWARPILFLSLLGILVQMAYSCFMTNVAEVYSVVQDVVMPLLLIGIGIGLVLFAKS